MMPVREILMAEGPHLGVDTPTEFFWMTGGLSAVLDNAPTYLSFFSVAEGLGNAVPGQLIAGVAEPLLVAISLGAVMFGSLTLIGNAPNFLVANIAKEGGVHITFFRYAKWAVVILAPWFVLLWVFFIRA
jgi:Na+/H+ antiporter NhaD/arsenite permease-like protein